MALQCDATQVLISVSLIEASSGYGSTIPNTTHADVLRHKLHSNFNAFSWICILRSLRTKYPYYIENQWHHCGGACMWQNREGTSHRNEMS